MIPDGLVYYSLFLDATTTGGGSNNQIDVPLRLNQAGTMQARLRVFNCGLWFKDAGITEIMYSNFWLNLARGLPQSGKIEIGTPTDANGYVLTPTAEPENYYLGGAASNGMTQTFHNLVLPNEEFNLGIQTIFHQSIAGTDTVRWTFTMGIEYGNIKS